MRKVVTAMAAQAAVSVAGISNLYAETAWQANHPRRAAPR